MKKRAFVLLVLAAVVPFMASAQTSQEVENPRWKGFVTNKFWDNWFIQVGGGVQMLSGSAERDDMDFSDRISPVIDLSVGKWFVPTLGARLQISGLKVNGITRDPANIHTDGTRYDGATGYYEQEIDQFNVHADALLNISNWIGKYRPDRFYDFIPFAGFGFTRSYSANRYDFMFTGGLINQMRLADWVDLNVEFRGNLYKGDFDRDPGNYKAIGAVTAGFSFNLGKKDFDKNEPTVISTGISRAEYDAVRDALAAESARAERLAAELAAERAKEKGVQVVEKTVPLMVFFKINRANVTPQEKVNLKQYAEIIKKNPNKTYTVVGYADKATGSVAYNKQLSEKRAQNVADVLVKEYGVSASQLKVEGKGGIADLFGSDVQLNRVVIVD